jgi:hypothetical protein
MSIDLKTTGLDEFTDALLDYEAASSKTRAEVLEHRARNLSFALYREAIKVGREAMRTIKTISARKMKIRQGTRTQKQEKARRIFSAGFVASGWLPSIKRFRSSGSVNALAVVKSPQGGVNVNRRENYIELVNSTPGAVEAEAKHGISDKALRGQAEDMRKYLQAKADGDIARAWR